jgi:hypothetical protein
MGSIDRVGSTRILPTPGRPRAPPLVARGRPSFTHADEDCSIDERTVLRDPAGARSARPPPPSARRAIHPPPSLRERPPRAWSAAPSFQLRRRDNRRPTRLACGSSRMVVARSAAPSKLRRVGQGDRVGPGPCGQHLPALSPGPPEPEPARSTRSPASPHARPTRIRTRVFAVAVSFPSRMAS